MGWSLGRKVPLKVSFPNLFFIYSQQNRKVENIDYWKDESLVWDHEWRGDLFVEGHIFVDSLLLEIQGNTISINRLLVEAGKWMCLLDCITSFLDANLAANTSMNSLDLILPLVWASSASSKVIVFTWHLFQDMIPMKEDIIKHHIILDHDGISWDLFSDSLESFSHSLEWHMWNSRKIMLCAYKHGGFKRWKKNSFWKWSEFYLTGWRIVFSFWSNSDKSVY